MIGFSGRCLLLDIEGTTSSISFVYDVMFPFVRRELDTFLQAQWTHDDVVAACDRIAGDAGASLAEWSRSSDDGGLRAVRDEVIRLMDDDVKATGLKQLQGLIWKAGFESGEMQAHVYEDVPPAIRSWVEADRQVYIYSSGSIAAQKLFFGHTIVGDLLPLLSGHYDTTTGPKQAASSYAQIASEIGERPDEILFLSDVPAELNAARESGMNTGLCVRPGNAPAEANHGHPEVTDFGQIVLR